MKTWTIDEMLANGLCGDYPRERLEELWAGREKLSVLEILDLDIPAKDRIWAALQAGDHVAAAVERIITRAVTNHCLSCGVPQAEAGARAWLQGDRSAMDDPETSWALRSASEAARAAWVAVAAAETANACGAAAWARWAAGVADAADAADAVARSAERERQIEDIREAVLMTEKESEHMPDYTLPISRAGEQQFACVLRNRSGMGAGEIDFGLRDCTSLCEEEQQDLVDTVFALYEAVCHQLQKRAKQDARLLREMTTDG